MQQYQSDVLYTDQPQFASNRLRVLVVGSRGSGKTALIRRLIDNTYRETAEAEKPDRFDLQRLNVVARTIDNEMCKVELQEVGSSYFGAEESTSADDPEEARVHEVVQWLDVQTILCLFDVTSTESYTEAYRIHQILQKKAAPGSEIFLVGTKTDLKTERQISFVDAEEEALRRNLSIYDTSSKEGSNMELLIHDVVDSFVERFELQMEYHQESNILMEEQPVYQDPVQAEEHARPSIFCWWPFNRT